MKSTTVSQSLFSNNPPQLNNAYAIGSSALHRFPNEAIYIYSIEKQTMVYLSGWKELLGYENDEITLSLLVSLTIPEYMDFCSEMNQKAFSLAFSLTEKFEEYCCLIETKKYTKSGEIITLLENAGIHKTENGKITEIIAKYQQIKIGRVNSIRYYETYGPDKSTLDDVFAEVVDQHLAISGKEKEVMSMAARGLSIKEMADRLKVSSSAIEKRLMTLYRRFQVSNVSHLISFAYENGILP
jgi:DNA-binding CsgD family transcriptional regulator